MKKSIFSLENLYIYWSISISRTLHLPICTYFYSLNMQSMSICYSFRFPQHEKHVPQRLAFSLHVKHICIKRHAAIVVFSAYFFQKNICHESINFFSPCITNFHFFQFVWHKLYWLNALFFWCFQSWILTAFRLCRTRLLALFLSFGSLLLFQSSSTIVTNQLIHHTRGALISSRKMTIIFLP